LQLISAVAGHIIAAKPHGGILIFLPGVQEIRQCIQALNNDLGPHAEIMPLHANLTSDEQRAVFRTTQRWKIVVATNVAEVSHL
jgi:ATP-dependent RNA helicase DHX57